MTELKPGNANHLKNIDLILFGGTDEKAYAALPTPLEKAKAKLDYINSDLFPENTREYSIANPNLQHVWQNPLTPDYNHPYFVYSAGTMWYKQNPDRSNPDNHGFMCPLTPELLETLWGDGLGADTLNVSVFTQESLLRTRSTLSVSLVPKLPSNSQ